MTAPPSPAWRCGRFTVDLSVARVMAILNLTDDSFSDGGRLTDPAQAIAAARQAVDAGADLLDLGAESTRPGAVAVSPEAEWARLEPVLAALATGPVPVSVDTRRPSVMVRAIEAGAAIINDIEGFRTPGAVEAVAGSAAGLVVMHMQGEPGTMQDDPVYGDVVAEVGGFLAERVRALRAGGVAAERIVVDPGFGFGKTLAHNLALAGALPAIGRIAPVLVGLSRKSMLGRLTGRPVDQRLGASIAAALASVAAGARIVRVHDVAETVSALKVWQAFQENGSRST